MHAASATELLPQLLREMGREGSQQDEQAGQGLTGHSNASRLQVIAHRIAEFHQLRNGGVELVVAAEVFADRGDGGVHRPA